MGTNELSTALSNIQAIVAFLIKSHNHQMKTPSTLKSSHTWWKNPNFTRNPHKNATSKKVNAQ